MNPDQCHTIQTHLPAQPLQGWLLYNFHDLDPIAKRLAPLPPHVD